MPRPKGAVKYNLNDFFRRVSVRVNYIDEDVVKQVFYEIIRTLIRDVRRGRSVFFPWLGYFYIKHQKPRLMYRPELGRSVQYPAKNRFYFRADRRLVNYFNEMELIK